MSRMKPQEHREESQRFILLWLLREGSLSSKDLEEKTRILFDQFSTFGIHLVSTFLRPLGVSPEGDRHYKRRDERHEKARIRLPDESAAGIAALLEQDMIFRDMDNRYQLTEKGEREARRYAQELEGEVALLERRFLSPSAAARNTVIADFFLAVMKLVAGLLSGSVGLLADGADAAIDTASASIVWLGIKYKREFVGTLVIILMMFVTAGSVGFESLTKIVQAVIATIPPLLRPNLVIVVEGLALLTAALLSVYQRYVGKNKGSFALISQSIDSKNHIFVAAAVILGATFSIFGIHFVDALIGAFIAVRIFIDDFRLSKDVLLSLKGEETDFTKYKTPFKEQWHLSKLETFRTWIVFSIIEEKLNTKDELITSLEKTFKSAYIPVLSEFKFSLGEGFDFDTEFDRLIEPLVAKRLVIKRDDTLMVTKEGKNYVDRLFKGMRYHQRE
jgi:cation diffusion facilitator family transporter